MPDKTSKTGSPGPFRWATVGLACYLGWALTNVAFALFLPVFLIIEAVGGKSGLRFLRSLCVRFLSFFFLKYFSLIGVYSVEELPDSNKLARDGKFLFVANHRSWVDALLLLALIPNVRIPISAAYTKVPLISRAMRWLGCITLDKNSRESIASGVEEMRGSMRAGAPVAAFPEGTRSEAGRLKPFLDLFFKVAIEEGATVIPIVIHLSSPFLGPGKENFLTRAKTALRIRLLDEVDVDSGETASELSRRVHKRMAAELTELDSLGNNV